MSSKSLIFICAAVLACDAASLYIKDSYQKSPEDSNENEVYDINDNIIAKDEYYGLSPPKQIAVDYYKKFITKVADTPAIDDTEYRKSPYEIDATNKVIKLKATTDAAKSEEEDRKSEEDEHVINFDISQEQDKEQMKLAFELFTSYLSMIFNNTDGLLDSTEVDASMPIIEDVNSTELISDDDDDDKSTDTTLDPTTVISTINYPTTDVVTDDEVKSSVGDMISTIWTTMRASVEYVGSLLRGLWGNDDQVAKVEEITTSSPMFVAEDTTVGASTPSESSPISSSTMFAFDAPSSFHRFPSVEAEKGRDIDSLMYGHAIV